MCIPAFQFNIKSPSLNLWRHIKIPKFQAAAFPPLVLLSPFAASSFLTHSAMLLCIIIISAAVAQVQAESNNNKRKTANKNVEKSSQLSPTVAKGQKKVIGRKMEPNT